MTFTSTVRLLFMVWCFIRPVLAQAPLDIQLDGVRLQMHGISEEQAEPLVGELKDQITLAGQSTASEPLADDLAFFAKQKLIRDGYPDATVSWTLITGGVRLEFHLGEGATLGTIQWEGSLPLPQEELEKFFLRPFSEQPDADKKNPRWVEADASSGLALVTRRLRADGYLDAECQMDVQLPDASRSHNVKITVNTGKRYTFGKITLNGAPDLLDEREQALATSHESEPFSEAALQNIEREMTSTAADEGWLKAQASSSHQRGTMGGEVDVTITLTPGRRSVITRVDADSSLSAGGRRVLKATFEPMLDRPWSSSDSDIAYRRALDTGMFARLDHEVIPLPDAAPHADPVPSELRFSGEETPPCTLGIEGGLDTFFGAQAGLTYRDTNLWNAGLTLASALRYSLVGPTGYVSLTDPALFNSAYSGTARVSADSFLRYEYNRYTLAIDADIDRRVSRHFVWSLFAAVSASAVTADIPLSLIGPDSYGYMTGGFSATLDYRDSPTLPRKGWMLSGSVDYNYDAFGEAASYVRTQLFGSYLLPLGKKWRLAVGGRAESIQGADLSEVPIDNRVFNGGPTSVRAFAMRELGPVTEGGTPLGGTAAVFASVEVSREILPNLELAVFVDTGSLSREKQDTPLGYSTDFRHAVGAGVRYLLPFGPIRIDYGYNLDRRQGESTGQLHVTAGFAF
jgi:outer membrane translocation and assembly module TamA